MVIVIIIATICTIRYKNYLKNNPDVSNAKKAVIINEDVTIYKKAKESRKIEEMTLGENVYILDTIEENDKGTIREWYKVREVFEKKNKKGKITKTYNKVGYILKSNVKYYEQDTSSEHVLMSDVSKFDIINEYLFILI